MSVTYTDQVRPPAARLDAEAYVPVYARSGARKSNKPVKTWMILAPLGVLVIGGAATAMLMQPAEPTLPVAAQAAPAAPLTAPEPPLVTAPSIPAETPAALTTATPITPPAATPVERQVASPPVAPAGAARVAPRALAPAPEVEAPVVSAGPQPYLSVAPQTTTPQTTAPAPVTPPAPIVITPTT